MVAMSFAVSKDDVEMKQKEQRKNFMHEIRGALISGDVVEPEAKIVKKKKGKKE